MSLNHNKSNPNKNKTRPNVSKLLNKKHIQNTKNK